LFLAVYVKQTAVPSKYVPHYLHYNYVIETSATDVEDMSVNSRPVLLDCDVMW